MFDIKYLPKNFFGAAAIFASLGLSAPAQATDLNQADDGQVRAQLQDFALNKVRSMRDFQPFRKTAQAATQDGTEITFTSLNPVITGFDPPFAAHDGSRGDACFRRGL